MAEKFKTYSGDVDLRNIDIQKLDKWKASLLKHVSPATFNIYQRFLQAAFNIALKWKYINTNPFTEVKKESVDEKRNFFTADELELLLATLDADINNPQKRHIKQSNILFKQYVEFLVNTGLRRNEALALRIEQVDFEKNLIYIERTKGKKYRPIPLTKKAREILLQVGNGLFAKLNADMVTHKFGDILQRIGLQYLKLHSLRHTFATQLVSAGVDIYAVKELLGHQDIRTSMVYAKADTDALQKAVDKLNN
ncbi:MAG: site-specific integrase [Ignavibacteriae bacterium]|nr:site-specific integrase [Ignavibacteriota bacterium]